MEPLRDNGDAEVLMVMVLMVMVLCKVSVNDAESLLNHGHIEQCSAAGMHDESRLDLYFYDT